MQILTEHFVTRKGGIVVSRGHSNSHRFSVVALAENVTVLADMARVFCTLLYRQGKKDELYTITLGEPTRIPSCLTDSRSEEHVTVLHRVWGRCIENSLQGSI
jgi:hypothetical protein